MRLVRRANQDYILILVAPPLQMPTGKEAALDARGLVADRPDHGLRVCMQDDLGTFHE
jgi:hypothetical protein